ncbi:hypothetical protein M3Y98_00389500 [Aphelenchoides besseyi]|nr:hypothetical protein M3Y98_00389500 [Aphelenchoides besseyi]
MGNKPTIKHAFDIGEGYYAIHVSTEEAQSTPTQLNTAVDKSDCLVEMPVDPLDKPEVQATQPTHEQRAVECPSVALLQHRIGAQVLEAKKDLQKLIDTLPGGKTREFYQSQLAAVKFIGSIADDVEGVQEGRLKFAYPWALYFDPANKNEIRAIQDMTFGMEKELKRMDANNANRKLLKQQIKNLNELLYHCMAAEMLETKQTTAFGYGKKKPRSTMAEDDGEKYGL